MKHKMTVDLLIWLAAFFMLVVFFAFLTDESNRSQKLKVIAETLNCEFVSHEKTSLIANLKQDLSLFSQGETNSISNLIYGRYQNTPFRLFDYEFWLAGNRKWGHKLTVLWIESPKLDLPRFTVHPKSWASNLMQTQANCNGLVLYGDDEAWLKQLCVHITDNANFANLTIKGGKSNIILYSFNGPTDERIPPKKENIVGLIETGIQFYTLTQQTSEKVSRVIAYKTFLNG